MANKLEHHQIQGMLTALAEGKIVNLDAPISALIDPVAGTLAKTGAGGELAIHVLCCNEYFLVTGLTDQGDVVAVSQMADAIRSALSQSQTRKG